MYKSSDIKKLLKEIVFEENTKPFTATVISVEADTCTIKLVGDLQISGVRLRATSNETTGVLITPKKNSQVLVISLTGGLENLTVIKINEVETINITVDNTDFEIAPTGFCIKANGEDLKAVLNDLITEVNKIFVVQGTTINVAATLLIQERLNRILV